jgi:cell division protein FtsB
MNQNKNKLIQKFHTLTDPRVLGFLAFGVVTLLVTWSGIKAVQKNYELEKRITISRQNSEIQKLENENLKLRNHYYESAQYLELSARRQFGKAAPGETLYTVPEEVALSKTVEPAAKLQTPAEEKASQPRFQQNFNDWAEFLFN